MTKKMNKYLYMWVVQGYYVDQHGWEDLTQSESYKDAKENLRDYRENDPYGWHRMIQRRVKNENYQE